jgi:hypothetical protein
MVTMPNTEAVTLLLSIAGSDHSNSVDEMQQPFTVSPIASSIAIASSAKQARGLSQNSVVADSLQTSYDSESDEDLAGALASARKRKKVSVGAFNKFITYYTPLHVM